MNTKKFVIGSVAVFVVMFILEYLLHGIILESQYLLNESLYRSEEACAQYFPAMLLAYIMISFGFCYIFIRGYEGKGIAEGIRYGLLVSFAFVVPSALINYTVYPVSGWIMLGVFIGFPIECMIMGAVMAAIYKPQG